MLGSAEAVTTSAAVVGATTSRDELKRLNLFELNEIIDQIENTTKELSDTLVQARQNSKKYEVFKHKFTNFKFFRLITLKELALRDELEFEKETRNTFISLLMSIQVLFLDDGIIKEFN